MLELEPLPYKEEPREPSIEDTGHRAWQSLKIVGQRERGERDGGGERGGEKKKNARKKKKENWWYVPLCSVLESLVPKHSSALKRKKERERFPSEGLQTVCEVKQSHTHTDASETQTLPFSSALSLFASFLSFLLSLRLCLSITHTKMHCSTAR